MSTEKKSQPRHNFLPYVRTDADLIRDVRWKRIPLADRTNALWVLTGLTGLSRSQGTYGLVPEYRAAMEDVVGRLNIEEDQVIDLLVAAGWVTIDGDNLTLVDWWDWQQTEQDVAAKRAQAQAAQAVRWAKATARKIEAALDRGLSPAAIKAEHGGDPEKWALALSFLAESYTARMPVVYEPDTEEKKKEKEKKKEREKTTTTPVAPIAVEQESGTDEEQSSSATIIPIDAGAQKRAAAAALVREVLTAEVIADRAAAGKPPVDDAAGQALVTAVVAKGLNIDDPEDLNIIREVLAYTFRIADSPAAYYPTSITPMRNKAKTAAATQARAAQASAEEAEAFSY